MRRSDRLDDLRPLCGWFRQQWMAVLPEAENHRQQPTFIRKPILVELVDVGVNRLDVFAEPLPLGQKTSGCVKSPDNQRASLLRCRRISIAIRSTAPSTPPTCSALPRIETVWPSNVAVGTINSLARRTSSLTSSVAGAPLEASRAVRSALRPPSLCGGDRWSESWCKRPRCSNGRRRVSLIEVLKRRLGRRHQVIHHPALKLAARLLMDAITCERKAHEQNTVQRQAHQKGRQLKLEPPTQPSRQPGKSHSRSRNRSPNTVFSLLGRFCSWSQSTAYIMPARFPILVSRLDRDITRLHPPRNLP